MVDARVGTSRRNGGNRSPLPAWGLVAGLLALALLLAVVVVRYHEPEPAEAEAPEAEFSAARARWVLTQVLGPGVPHPLGSAENGRVRQRIIDTIRNLGGYQVEVQDAVACHPTGSCGRVRNVLAVRPGSEPGKVVLVATHYDSVAAGPGVGDDLAAVAASIETARALLQDRDPRHTVVFLIGDGEEAGLLGAHAFVNEHPLARRVGAVVNVEARGTAGPSLMFETDRDNAWLVGLWGAAAPRPITSSLFSTIYERMPNDTDFTVFKAAGMRGLNFAMIGNPAHYHTPLDDAAHLSAGSLQHHGDNLLAAVRALAAADLAEPPRGAAVFFDVLGYGVVRWPAAWSLPLALLALLLVVVAAVRLVRAGDATLSGAALGLLAAPAMALAAGLVAWLAWLGLRGRGAYGAVWLADRAAAAPFWLLAVAAGLAVAALLARRAGAAGAWCGVWLLWAVLGVVAAVALPGISFLFVVPALLAGLAGLLGPSLLALGAFLPLVAAGTLWFPILRFLPAALGAGVLVAIAALVAWTVSGLAPLAGAADRIGRRASVAALALAGLGLVGWALARPAFTPESPLGLNVGFSQTFDGGGRPLAARIYAAADPLVLPAELAAATAWEEEPQPLQPWSTARVRVAPAPPLPLAPPAVTVTSDARTGGDRRLGLRLTSQRGAEIAGLVIPEEAQVRSATVEGAAVPDIGGRLGPWATPGWRFVTFTGLPAEGIEVELVLGAAGPVEAWIFDRSYGLPQEVVGVAQARPATAVPIGGGDATVLTRPLLLPAAP